MGPSEQDEHELSRRGFLGWGAGLLAAVAAPGAMLGFAASPASAAPMSPYALSTWAALRQRPVQLSAPGQRSTTLIVTKVTDMAAASTTRMTGDSFAVVFRASRLLPYGIYTVTAATLGSVALFVEGVDATTARLLINRRLPARN